MPICLDIHRVCHAHATGFHFVMPNFTLNTCFTHRKKIARENKNITTSTKTAGLYPQYFFYVIARKKVWKILVRNCVLRVKAGTPLLFILLVHIILVSLRVVQCKCNISQSLAEKFIKFCLTQNTTFC